MTIPASGSRASRSCLLHNGDVTGKTFAGDGSVKVTPLINDNVAVPSRDLKIGFDVDGAAPIEIPVTVPTG